jgi:type II secretory pathway predicted ATPase ExeA
LQSASFDSQSLLFTVLCGDARLPNRFRTPELLPLGSRIRARLDLSGLTPQDLASYLDFVLQKAGAPQLIAPELIKTLATHAHGNLRVLTHMAAELLTAAAERNLPRIDEPLYFDLFTPPARQSRRS